MKTDVFKFLTLRAPDTGAMESRADDMVRDDRPFLDTTIGGMVGRGTPPLTEEGMMAGARDFISRSGFFADKTEPLLKSLGDLFKKRAANFDGGAFPDELKALTGGSPLDFVQGKEFDRLWSQSWDKLYAFYITKRTDPVNLEGITRDIRSLNLLDDLARGKTTASAATLSAYAGFTVAIPAALAAAFPAPKAPPKTTPKSVLDGYDALWRQFGALYRARKELGAVTLTQKAQTASAPKALSLAPVKTPKKSLSPITSAGTTRYTLTIPSETLSGLHEATRTWLKTSGLSLDNLSLPAMTVKLNADLAGLQSKILAIKDPVFFGRMPREEEWSIHFATTADYYLLPGFFPIGGALDPDVLSVPLADVKPLGIGDLKVVKQTFERYSEGEISYVETVLQGEYKERRYRQLNRTEDTTTHSESNTQDTETDTQKTDRFELKKASETVISEDMSVHAGLTVSASYGPVSIGAHGDFAYSTSSRDTEQNSSNFAREIVDKSITKIQKAVKDEQIHKVTRETEETNIHSFDNKAGTGNINGLYRWLEKHYRAQVYNYGRRLMFEFIVPEPAAYLRYNKAAAAAASDTTPPLIPLGDITHRDITEWNYNEYIQRYGVQGCEPPPPQYTIITTAMAQGDLPEHAGRAETNKELNVPPGYTAKYWTAQLHYSIWANGEENAFDMMVGTSGNNTLNDEDTCVPIALHYLNGYAYALTVEVYCERTPRAFEEWQLRTYEKITAAYRAMAADKKDQQDAAANTGAPVTGQNPDINRVTEKTELKKSCITILSNQFYDRFSAVSGTPPEINIPEALWEGKFIQFLEQAFEWEQMTYLFYPYFWGRKGQWSTVLNAPADPDPLFDQFLKAGAARVLIPVEPMYNESVLYYLKTGRVWNGGEAPTIDDPLFVALYEEVRNQQDDLENAVPEGEPWEVVIPTSLVYLQMDSSLETTNEDLADSTPTAP